MESVKMFLHRSSGKRSAIEILSSYRTFLDSKSIAHITSPILAKLSLPMSATNSPSAILSELRAALYQFQIEQEKESFIKKAEKRKKQSYSYIGQIFTREEELILDEEFTCSNEAYHWVESKLASCELPGAYGTMTFNQVMIEGKRLEHKVTRDEVLAGRAYKKGAATRIVGKVSNSAWQMRARQDRAYFSRA